MKPSDILQLRELGFWKALTVVAAILFLTFLIAVASGLGKWVVGALGSGTDLPQTPVREQTLRQWFEQSKE